MPKETVLPPVNMALEQQLLKRGPQENSLLPDISPPPVEIPSTGLSMSLVEHRLRANSPIPAMQLMAPFLDHYTLKHYVKGH